MGNQVHCCTSADDMNGQGNVHIVAVAHDEAVEFRPALQFLDSQLDKSRSEREKLAKTPVYLNIYHLSESWKQTNRIASELLGFGGAFHAAIEVFGSEYTYGCEGVRRTIARGDPEHVYHQSILMGETDYTREELQDLIEELEREWRGDEYDMLKHNCCSFSSFLSEELVDSPIPAWVNRLAQVASNAAILNGGIRNIVN